MDNEMKQYLVMIFGIIASVMVAVDPADVATALGADTEYVQTLFRIGLAVMTGVSSATGVVLLKR